MQVDYLVVGSGLTGAVIARTLADADREVLIVERRRHVGGNVHDYAHASGIRIHTYGPHYFRTNSDRIWEFACRFASFYNYEPALLSQIGRELEQWPIAGSYIRRKVAKNWAPDFVGSPSNLEEAALAIMPRLVYETFVKEYNEKQWGVPATTLAPSLCGRFDVREDDEPRLKPSAKYQGIPDEGYASWMSNMLRGIPIVTNYDYLDRRRDISAKKRLVFTGPIDEYFGFEFGRLGYRGQRRRHTYHADVTGFHQPCGQINNPLHNGGPHLRTLEWKHMMRSDVAKCIRGTVLTTETPFTPTEPNEFEYPFPDNANAELYERYRRRAKVEEGLLIAGRLGEYRYYDMDQAIGRALTLAERILVES